MPEGSEIRVYGDMLKSVGLNKKLMDIKFLSGKFVTRADRYQDEINDIKGIIKEDTHIIKIKTKGKFLWFILANSKIVGIVFGITGKFTFDSKLPYNRIEFKFDNDSIYFNDVNNLGQIYVWNEPTKLNDIISNIGIDVLNPKNENISKQDIINHMRKYNNLDIVSFLTNQKIFGGNGNIIKSEVLYDCQIYPYAIVKLLTDTLLYEIYKSIVKISTKYYQYFSKNHTIQFEKLIEPYTSVYNKKTDPLGNIIVKLTDTKDKLDTYFVPNVQILGCEYRLQ
jgi:formamidopyrimidine-DNA glycosylase